MNLGSLRRVRWSREHLVALVVVLALLALLVPLPGFLLDLLLTLSLASGVAVLLVALVAEGPLGFPTLPGVLVAGSLARVALALAVARSLLAHGAAGSLVQTLGGLLTAAGENPIGGVAILGLLLLAGYVVLNLGLMRLAEVAARFALDALPGQQMALDAALSSGRMAAEAGEAQTERLRAENAFYGAMDGAARFLRGETLAVALIVVLVPLAGLTTANAAALEWTDLVSLALGQGAVVLVPALLMMAAGALVLSRTESGAATGGVGRALLRPGLLVTVAVALAVVAAVPGLAKAPLLLAACAAAGLAWHVIRRPAAAPAPGQAAELQLGLGTSLLALTARHDLSQWFRKQRLALSDELGFAVPPFLVKDDAALPPNDFAILVNGGVVMQATLRPGRRLAVAEAGGLASPEGEPVVLPDGRAAAWVREPDEGAAAAEGGPLLEPLEALELYLRAALTAAAPELFDLQRAEELLAAVRVSHPAVVDAVAAAGLTARELRQVGRALLAERVPLVERVSLLEAMAAEAGSGPASRLMERVRPALRRTITRQVAPEGTLYALEPGVEMQQELLRAVERAGEAEAVALPPERAEHWHRALRGVQAQHAASAVGAVICCAPEVRWAVAQLGQEAGAAVAAVHAGELLPLTEIITIGVLPDGDAVAAPQATMGR